MWLLIFAILFVVGEEGIVVEAQGISPTGDFYVCVPPGTCNNPISPRPPNWIDPRIVTPGQVSCPAGLVPCYGQGSMSTCGRRLSTVPASTADGPASMDAHPWMVYLSNSTHPYAGSGVLLDPYHVLTAAHKVRMYLPPYTGLIVRLGVYDPATMLNVQNVAASQIIIHPSYDSVHLINDIAIIRLATPVVLAANVHVNTACLPQNEQTFVGQRCMVAGWGQTSAGVNDAPTNPMKQVTVGIVDYATCRASFANPTLLGTNVDLFLDPAGEICAGGEQMRDACFQDGGAPLMCLDATSQRYYIAGLVIWGKSCGQPGVYGVYVSVPHYINSFIIPTITTT